MLKLTLIGLLFLFGVASAVITATNLYSGGSSAAAQSSFVTSSISPSANKLILLAVGYYTSGAGASPSVTGNGLTWVKIADTSYYSNYKLYLFRAMGSSPSAGAVTISFSVGDIYNVGVGINEFGNADTSGTSGSGAIVQNATNTGEGTSLTVTLGAFGSTDDATFGAFSTSHNAMTPGTGFIELSEYDATGWGSDIRTQTEWRNDSDTSVDVSSSYNAVMGIAVEIKQAAAPPPNTCTYGGSGNWIINLADLCNLTVSTNVGTNNITFNGTSGYATFSNTSSNPLIFTASKFIWQGFNSAYLWFKTATWFNGTMGS